MMGYEAQIAGVDQQPGKPGRAGAMQRAVDRASSPSVAAPRSPRSARSPTSSSSTAAAPARSSARTPTRRSPRSPRARVCSARTCSTATGSSPPLRPRRSRSAWCGSPTPDIATLLGGGWIASGPPAARPAAAARVAAGPDDAAARGGRRGADARSRGGAARRCAVGDRVWLRHTKAGEVERAPERVRGRRRTARSSASCRPTAARERCSCEREVMLTDRSPPGRTGPARVERRPAFRARPTQRRRGRAVVAAARERGLRSRRSAPGTASPTSRRRSA